jgi:hypothetical protein
MSPGGYESWFLSARDPGSPRALWIRHTRHRPRRGPASTALWCILADRSRGRPPVVIKQVFGAFPAGAAAGPRQFRGNAAMGLRTAYWDLTISSPQPPLQPLRPAVLRRTPLPRTKLEASVPDGWLELVLARIRIGRARLPWTAMGALSLDGERIPLGGLGRRPRVDGQPGRLTADIPSPGARLQLTVTTGDDDAVAVRYADPAGSTRVVRHAPMASVELILRRPGNREAALSSSSGAYEYGTSQDTREITPGPLPEG